MKLVDRHAVEGTEPTIYIGHRTYRHKKTGETRACRSWYCEYCLSGDQQYAPLGTQSRAVAIRVAFRIVGLIAAGLNPSPVSDKLADVAHAYLGALIKKARAPRTVQKYRQVLTRFIQWLERGGKTQLRAIREADFWDYYAEMQVQGASDKSRYDRAIIIKQLFKWSAGPGGGYTLNNPLRNVHIDQPESSAQPFFSPEQVLLLLQSAGEELAPVFAMMAYAGLRVGEVQQLLWADLLLEQGQYGYIVVRRGGGTGKTKSRRTRRIPIHPALRSILDRVPRNRDRLFVSGSGKPLDERHLLFSLKRLCADCHFTNPNQYKLHTFRHTFASMCARSNISYKYGLEWMGHRSSGTLDLYYHLFDKTAEAAIASIQYGAADA